MVKKTNLAFNNCWSEATELTLSDSMSIVSGSKLEFRVLLLAAGRKPEHPVEQQTQPTCEVSSRNRTQAAAERCYLLLLLKNIRSKNYGRLESQGYNSRARGHDHCVSAESMHSDKSRQCL